MKCTTKFYILYFIFVCNEMGYFIEIETKTIKTHTLKYKKIIKYWLFG